MGTCLQVKLSFIDCRNDTTSEGGWKWLEAGSYLASEAGQ